MRVSIIVATTLGVLIMASSFLPYKAAAQLPECNRIYMDINTGPGIPASDNIYTFDPTMPAGPNNPSVNSISFSGYRIGLTVTPVLGSGNTTSTFYTVGFTTGTGTFSYYDPATSAWVNTGHIVPVAAGNLAAGGGFIYALDGGNGDVYKYDGTGNANLLVNVANFAYEGPFDLVADCEGFYILNSSGQYATPFLRKYSSSGVLLRSWTINNPNNYRAWGGFAIIGNNIYIDHLYMSSPYVTDSVGIVYGEITNTSINLNSISPALTQYVDGASIGDLASCERTITRALHIEIESTDTAFCGAKAITYTANKIEDRGPAPAYQWFVNGVPVPGANDTFYTYTPQHGDIVTCQLGTNEPCAASSPVLSNPITMTVDTAIQPVLTYDPDEICTDRTALLLPSINTSGGIFSAGPGLAINSATGAINPAASTPGAYTVTYTNPAPLVCPQYTDQVTVTVHAAAAAKIEITPYHDPICISDTVVLHTQEAPYSSYSWEPSERITGPKNEATALVKRDRQGYVRLTVIAAGGCKAEDSVYVDMGTSCCRVFLPTAFSPNNDGLNDVWKPVVSDIQAVNSFKVFNRFGQLVFESHLRDLSWDGMQNGQPCDLGVYFYAIRYTCDDGSEQEKKGELTLVR